MCVKGGATSHEGERDWKGMTATGFTVALSHSKIKNNDNDTQRTTRTTFALLGDPPRKQYFDIGSSKKVSHKSEKKCKKTSRTEFGNQMRSLAQCFW